MEPTHQRAPQAPAVRRSAGASLLKFPLALAGHLGYLVTLALLVVVSGLVLLPLAPFPRWRRRVSSAMLRGYLGFFALHYLPACRACRVVEVAGRGGRPAGGPAIYVANHRSSIDAILLLALLPPTSLVIKARHARKLGYACMVRFFDFVPIAAGALSSLRQSMDKCRDLLAAGQNLLIFPEGMRASFTTLMPFADFAFRLAIARGVPIVPVVVHSDQPFLNRQKGSYFPKQMVQYRIRFLEPVTTSTKDDPVRLADAVSRRMAAEVADLDRQYLVK